MSLMRGECVDCRTPTTNRLLTGEPVCDSCQVRREDATLHPEEAGE